MLANYCIKTQTNNTSFNDGKPYIILSKTYYNIKEQKYKECGSMFIDKDLALYLIQFVDIRVFDNANVFKLKIIDKGENGTQ